MSAYYNEIDEYAAQWLRNLIVVGLIADGEVDTRSIVDVRPSDLAGFTQCHFFAGIGVWSYALRLAGWPDDCAIWSASCPCQPFSAAGKGEGFADERHLWPYFHWLTRQCRPSIIVGEQVASKDADDWVDLVQADMEGMGYAFGAVAFPSAGVGAPHIRDRTYWVADSESVGGRGGFRDSGSPGFGRDQHCNSGAIGRMAESDRERLENRTGNRRATEGKGSRRGGHPGDSTTGRMGHAHHVRPSTITQSGGTEEEGRLFESQGSIDTGGRPGPTNGIWRDADWLFCRDGKWRPVEPGTFPLAHGATARVGRLRAYGNAINAQQAKTFVEAVMECRP